MPSLNIYRNRVGLIGFNCNTGLGIVNRFMYKNLPFASWLVIEHLTHGIMHQYLDEHCVVLNTDDVRVMSNWLKGLDAVFAVEGYYIPSFDRITLERVIFERGPNTILMPNAEWLDLEDPTIRLIDRFIAPTKFCHDLLIKAGLGNRTEYIPHFVDINVFQFQLRKRAQVFVHYRGWGGVEGRKGTSAFIELARNCPDIPFVIWTQSDINQTLPANISVYGPTEYPEEQYRIGDVAIQPSRWEGVGLQILEAMASGIPTIVPDAPPMNEYPADACLLAKLDYTGTVELGNRLWPTAEVSIDSLTEIVRSLYNQDISSLSNRARKQMEQRSWNNTKPAYLKAFEMRD